MHLIFLTGLFRTLSWTFIHSLWQGLILTILAGLVMLSTRWSKASLRYGLLCLLLFLFLGGVAFTFLIEWNTGTARISGLKFMTNLGENDALFHHSLLQQLFEKFVLFLNSNSQWIVMIWLIVLGVKLIRMILDLVYTNRLRTHDTFKPGDEWIRRLEGLRCQLGIRKKVSLVESALIKIPGVVGYFKPVILIPVGILSSLPVAEVEAVLLHELAHIRRHDFVVNFIQRIAELFFFFNPGLLWVSSLLRIERENCCDDIAIEKTNDKVQFVNAMISFKEHSLKHSGYVLGLFGNRNLLLRRMTRIIYNRNKVLSPVELAFFIINVIVFILLVSANNRPEINSQPASIPIASSVDQIPSLSFGPIQQMQPLINREQMDGNKKRPSTFSGKKLPRRKMSVRKSDVTGGNIFLNQEQINENHCMAVTDQEGTDRKEEKMHTDLKQAQLLRLQAEKDRRQAEKDREQAVIDRMQAETDRMHADKNREQAAIDRQEAMKDRGQAEKDRLRAQKDREQAIRDRERAMFDRKRADKELMQNKTK